MGSIPPLSVFLGKDFLGFGYDQLPSPARNVLALLAGCLVDYGTFIVSHPYAKHESLALGIRKMRSAAWPFLHVFMVATKFIKSRDFPLPIIFLVATINI